VCLSSLILVIELISQRLLIEFNSGSYLRAINSLTRALICASLLHLLININFSRFKAMSPILIIPVLIELLAAAMPVITLAVANALMLATIWSEMSKDPEAAEQLQSKIDELLDNYFQQGELSNSPVRNDVLLPGESGYGQIVPLKVALNKGLTNSGKFVWLQDPLRATDWSLTILQAFPVLSRSPSVGDLPAVSGSASLNPFFPDGLPGRSGSSSGRGPPTPTFGPRPVTGATPTCKPWPPGGPFWDRYDHSGGDGSAGMAIPTMVAVSNIKVAVGGSETNREDVLTGVSGRVPSVSSVVVYPKSLPDIASGSVSAALTVRGVIKNNTRFTLIMRKEGEKHVAYASHGLAVANSTVCFPGQTIQIGGLSNGAGIEVVFRFALWDIPYQPDRDSLPPGKKAAANAIETDSRGLAAFVMKENEASNWVSNIYFFIDIPKVGSSKVNCSEKDKTDIRELSDAGDVVSYDLVSGMDHQMTGEHIKSTFSVGYGSHPTASFVLSNKA
jgi:hypothetical protein